MESSNKHNNKEKDKDKDKREERGEKKRITWPREDQSQDPKQ